MTPAIPFHVRRSGIRIAFLDFAGLVGRCAGGAFVEGALTCIAFIIKIVAVAVSSVFGDGNAAPGKGRLNGGSRRSAKNECGQDKACANFQDIPL
ncbi:MAG: hypothetical protein RLZZ444_694 [Pseudomonadota bacterium]